MYANIDEIVKVSIDNSTFIITYYNNGIFIISHLIFIHYFVNSLEIWSNLRDR